MTILVQQLRERASRATPGPWELQTSNSWRRIGTAGGRFADGNVLAPTTRRGDNHPDLAARQEDLDFIVAANPAAVLALLDQVEQLEKSLKLVQSHAHTAYTRGRQAGLADQEHTAREAMVAMNLARDQMLDENERFTDLLEKVEQELDQIKAENAELRRDAERYRWVRQPAHGNEVFAMAGGGECGGNMDAAIDQAMTKEQP